MAGINLHSYLTRLQILSLEDSCIDLPAVMPGSALRHWNPGRLLCRLDARIAHLALKILAEPSRLIGEHLDSIAKLQEYPHLPFYYQRGLFSVALKSSLATEGSSSLPDEQLKRIENISKSVIDTAKPTFLRIIARIPAADQTEENFMAVSFLLKNVFKIEHLHLLEHSIQLFLSRNTIQNLRLILGIFDGISSPQDRAKIIRQFHTHFPDHIVAIMPALHHTLRDLDCVQTRLSLIDLLGQLPPCQRNADVATTLARSLRDFKILYESQLNARYPEDFRCLCQEFSMLIRIGMFDRYLATADIFDMNPVSYDKSDFLKELARLDALSPVVLQIIRSQWEPYLHRERQQALITKKFNSICASSLVSIMHKFSKVSDDPAFLSNIFSCFVDLNFKNECNSLFAELHSISARKLPGFVEKSLPWILQTKGISRGILTHSIARLFDPDVHDIHFHVANETMASLVKFCKFTNNLPTAHIIIQKLREIDTPRRWALIEKIAEAHSNLWKVNRSKSVSSLNKLLSETPTELTERIFNLFERKKTEINSPEKIAFFFEFMLYFCSEDPELASAMTQIFRVISLVKEEDLQTVKTALFSMSKAQALNLLSEVIARTTEKNDLLIPILQIISCLPKEEQNIEAIDLALVFCEGCSAEQLQTLIRNTLKQVPDSNRKKSLLLFKELRHLFSDFALKEPLFMFCSNLPRSLFAPHVKQNIKKVLTSLHPESRQNALDLLSLADAERIDKIARIFSLPIADRYGYEELDFIFSALMLQKDDITLDKLCSLINSFRGFDFTSDTFKKNLAEVFFLLPEQKKELCLNRLRSSFYNGFDYDQTPFSLLRSSLPEVFSIEVYPSLQHEMETAPAEEAQIKAHCVLVHVPEDDETGALIRDVAARVWHFTSTASRKEVKNPYTLHEMILKNRNTPLVLPPLLFEEVEGVKIAFNLSQHMLQSTIMLNPPRRADLPLLAPLVTLREIFTSFKDRIRSLPPEHKAEAESIVREYAGASGTTYDRALQFIELNIFQDAYLQSLTSIDRPASEAVPHDVFHFSKIVETIHKESEEVCVGSVFSHKEHSFLNFVTSVRNCSAGKKEALHSLFHAKGLNTFPSGTFVEERLKWVVHALIVNLCRDLVSEEGPCMSALCGKEVADQISHQALFIKNNIAKLLGIDHEVRLDFFSHSIENFLVELPKSRMIEIVYNYLHPSQMIVRFEKILTEQMNPATGASTEQETEANTFKAHLGSLLTSPGDLVVDDEVDPPRAIITKKGVIHLLTHLGYFIVPPS